jgi:putative ABC transport system ATP-binding protein
VAGTDVAPLNRRQSAAFRGGTIGFIFQDFNLLPVLTVAENVEYPLLMVQDVAAAERKRRVNALLEGVGMIEQQDKFPDQISGGQQQRVAVARALVTNRGVLADEPGQPGPRHGVLVLSLMKRLRTSTRRPFSSRRTTRRSSGGGILTLEDGPTGKDCGGAAVGKLFKIALRNLLRYQRRTLLPPRSSPSAWSSSSCSCRVRLVQEHDDRPDHRLHDRACRCTAGYVASIDNLPLNMNLDAGRAAGQAALRPAGWRPVAAIKFGGM